VATTFDSFAFKIAFVATTFGVLIFKIAFVATTFGVLIFKIAFVATTFDVTGTAPAEAASLAFGSTCLFHSQFRIVSLSVSDAVLLSNPSCRKRRKAPLNKQQKDSRPSTAPS
jgi:hypothetical protein